MGCCGKKRESLSAPPRRTVEFRQAVTPPPVMSALRTMTLEYVGPTGLTIRGPASGKTYRFPTNGTQLAVDARDAQFLLAIPSLRKAAPRAGF
jgi:hypothetical protein